MQAARPSLPGRALAGRRGVFGLVLLLALVAVVTVAATYVLRGRDQGPPFARQAIQLGGEWFLNNQDKNFLYYTYNPARNSYPSSHHSLREMGALWSLTQLSAFLQDSRYTDLAQRGFAYFERTFVHDEQGDFTYVAITPKEIKLGYNAFAILTLLELDHPNKEELLRQLGRGILAQQNENGDFDTFFYSDRDTGEDYYPGEAALALMALYEHTGDRLYLDAVGKSLPFYRDYWANNPNTAFPPWQTQVYTRYFRATGNPAARDFVYSMSDYQLSRFTDRQGCTKLDGSAGSVIAVYAEGMASAYQLANEQGDRARADCYGRYVQEAAAIVVSLQCQAACVTENGYSPPALGGVFGSTRDRTMRVDRNQHGVLSLIRATQVGLIH